MRFTAVAEVKNKHMSKSWVIYKHTSPDGKVYIGMTCATNPEYRWSKGMKYKDQPNFFRAIVKYGWDNFTHEIMLRDLEYEEACEAEKRLIAEYNSCDRHFGYNVSPGGESPIPYKKRAISDAKKAELSLRRSEIMKEKWQDPVFREKTVNALRESAKSPEYRKRVSEGLKLALQDEGLREQRRAMMNKRFEDDTYRSFCIENLRHGVQTNQKRVVCIETGVHYPSITEASRQSGFSISVIHKSLKGRTHKTQTHWVYEDEYNNEFNGEGR